MFGRTKINQALFRTMPPPTALQAGVMVADGNPAATVLVRQRRASKMWFRTVPLTGRVSHSFCVQRP